MSEPGTPCSRKRCLGKEYSCSMELSLAVIGGKWKPLIVWHLRDIAAMRFSALRRTMPAITQKMLTQQLRELEADGLLTRTVFAEVPPRVEYALTDLGRGIVPILESLCRFGREFEARFGVEDADAPTATAAVR
ncbi:transcriptional regulator [Desulfovibrio aerotolerans]|uniref:Transcriptional regulator n=1 Tax=Solidesulfovibrio aerotolerans TaxID=295255 RepID=A0A7C9IJL0_9BACT|nr:helix-turn-helix domain-containing protein [Solidesulfovibrio aerotolerans]MYL81586.1 transcriptional regulator [Solidesulfovibrio aerotolerans]